MNKNIKLGGSIVAVIGVLIAALTLVSCKKTVPMYLEEFHKLTTAEEAINLKPGDLALFVDYSNCIADGMESPFYQRMVSPLTANAKHYWSIKGDTIKEESLEGKGNGVYERLNNVQETSYAALDKAIAQMAALNTESIMLTDGELFTQTASTANPNNPYMHKAFKEWLMKGHDIHIIAEPYKESYRGNVFDKKRFYIIFTDDRIEGNVYDRLKEIVNFEDFPQVDDFHLSGNYPKALPTNGNHSIPNETLAALITPKGAYEIQEWQIGWKNITDLIVNGYDKEGNPLPNGEKLIGDLEINKNAFGCYLIKDIDIRVSNINDAYYAICDSIQNGSMVKPFKLNAPKIDEFIIVDHEEFKKSGKVDLYFDAEKFAPGRDLDRDPYNYFKIEIIVKDLENVLGNNLEMFNFDSIVKPGQTNVSISESLKNCIYNDPDLLDKYKNQVLYTIYVKSDKY